MLLTSRIHQNNQREICLWQPEAEHQHEFVGHVIELLQRDPQPLLELRVPEEVMRDLLTTSRTSSGLPKCFATVIGTLLEDSAVARRAFTLASNESFTPRELAGGDIKIDENAAAMKCICDTLRRSIELSPDALGFSGSEKSASLQAFEKEFAAIPVPSLTSQLCRSSKFFFKQVPTYSECFPSTAIMPMWTPTRNPLVDECTLCARGILASCWTQGVTMLSLPMQTLSADAARRLGETLSSSIAANVHLVRCVAVSFPHLLEVSDCSFPVPVFSCADDASLIALVREMSVSSLLNVGVVVFGSCFSIPRDVKSSVFETLLEVTNLSEIAYSLMNQTEKMEHVVDCSDFTLDAEVDVNEPRPQWVPCVPALEGELLSIEI
jgi:hypothetical protein